MSNMSISEGLNLRSPLSNFGNYRNNDNIKVITENISQQMLTMMYADLTYAYSTFGAVIKNIVDQPVEIALQGGLTVTSKKISSDELEKLNQIIIESGDVEKIKRAICLSRLYGGSVLLPVQEGNDLTFSVLTRWDLQGSTSINSTNDGVNLEKITAVQGHKVDPKDFIIFDGLFTTPLHRQRMAGWGLSVIESGIVSIAKYIGFQNSIEELLKQARLDIVKIKNLRKGNTGQSDHFMQRILNNLTFSKEVKKSHNVRVLDSEDDWNITQPSFQGYGYLMSFIQNDISSAFRIPKSILFGESKGWQDNDGDRIIFHDMIASQIRTPYTKPIMELLRIRCADALGLDSQEELPDDLKFKFKEFKTPSDENKISIIERQMKVLETLARLGMSDLIDRDKVKSLDFFLDKGSST